MLHYKWNPCTRLVNDEEGLLLITEKRCQRLQVVDHGINSNDFVAALHHGFPVDKLSRMSTTFRSLVLSLEQERHVIKVNDKYPSALESRDCGYFLATQMNAIEGLSQIRESTVSIFGLGGTGSVILQHLVALGVRKFILLDSDIVESSNLNRQFIYHPEDVGSSKTSCARTYIKERNKNSKVSVINKQIIDANDLLELDVPSGDFIFNCLDSPAQHIEAEVYKYAQIEQTPAISCAVGLTLGHWGPLIIPHKTPTFDEVARRSEPKQANSDVVSAHPGPPIPWSFGPTNTLISTLCVKDAISWLAGANSIPSMGKRLTLDFSTYIIS